MKEQEHHGRKGARREYKDPVRRYANQILNIKLFCYTEGCNNYIKGKEGYNGSFTSEDGKYADLRNQCWYCSEHLKETDKKIKMLDEVKTLDDLKKRLNLSDADIGNAVHWLKLIEHHFFNADHIANYQNQAIDFCIENKIDFTVTQNNPYEMLTRFIRMKCPKCSGEMKLKSSGGDTHSHNIVCRCAKCGVEGELRIGIPDGMSFHFRK